MANSNRWLSSATYLALSALGVYYMRLSPASTAAGDLMAPIATDSVYTFAGTGTELRRSYTGIKAIDTGLSFLVAAFLPGAAGWNTEFQLQQAYFLFSFFPVIMIMSIEAGRTRNTGKILSYTGLWSLAYQTVGGAIVVPLWFLSLNSGLSLSTSASSSLPLAKAQALLPALAIGYLAPTIAMYWPWESIETTQLCVAIWQPCPLYVNILWFAFSALLPVDSTPSTAGPVKGLKNDYLYLKPLYLLAFVVSSSVQAYIAFSTGILGELEPIASLSAIFLPGASVRANWTLDATLLYIFQWDFWLIFTAAIVSCWQAIADLRHAGVLESSGEALQGCATVLGLALAFGPGGAVAITWWWRESKVRKLNAGEQGKKEA